VNAIYVLGSASATITNWLVHVHGPAAYAVVGALVFSETALFVGFFIPGEMATTWASLPERPPALGYWPGRESEEKLPSHGRPLWSTGTEVPRSSWRVLSPSAVPLSPASPE